MHALLYRERNLLRKFIKLFNFNKKQELQKNNESISKKLYWNWRIELVIRKMYKIY